MPVHIVRLGTPRLKNEGLRLGTVRRPPRGVKAKDYARLNYFDQWLPELAPSPAALRTYKSTADWPRFRARYRQEIAGPTARRIIQLLAKISKETHLSVGCYCKDETTCHRSLLKKILISAGARIA